MPNVTDDFIVQEFCLMGRNDFVGARLRRAPCGRSGTNLHSDGQVVVVASKRPDNWRRHKADLLTGPGVDTGRHTSNVEANSRPYRTQSG